MRSTLILLSAAALWSSLEPGAWAAEVKVIANWSVTASAVSADELKSVFLVTRTELADGSRVEPVLLKSGPVHDAFVTRYVGKTEATLETYYRSLVFAGKGLMPKTLASDVEMVNYVARTRGAIGYVSAGTTVSGVKTLAVK